MGMKEADMPKGDDIRVEFPDLSGFGEGVLAKTRIMNETPKEHVFFYYVLMGLPPLPPQAVYGYGIVRLWFGVKTTQQQRLDAIRAAADMWRLRHGC